MNCHPSPRKDNIRQYLKTLQRRDAQREKEQYADKGGDTLLDGYTEEEFERVCAELPTATHRRNAIFGRSSICSSAITC